MDLLAFIQSQKDSLVLLQAVIKAHCTAMAAGERLTSYSLNGRSFQWKGTLEDLLRAQEAMLKTMQYTEVPFAEVRIR